MELLKIISQEDRIIKYMVDNVRLVIQRPEYNNVVLIIQELCRICEIYFNKGEKQGQQKLNTVLFVLKQTIPSLDKKFIEDQVEYIIHNSKIIKKDYFKIVKYYKRHMLKRSIKKEFHK